MQDARATPTGEPSALTRRLRALTPANAAAAIWAWAAGTRARRQLRRGGLDAVSLPRLPVMARRGERGMTIVLGRRSLSCLEGSLVRQSFYAAQGVARELVIGVSGPGEEFGAHAWLEGDPEQEGEGFTQLHRRAPPAVSETARPGARRAGRTARRGP